MPRLDEIEALARINFRPRGGVRVSDWADEHRRLSPESSSEPGRWDTRRCEFQRAPMNSTLESRVTVLACAAQMGKSEILTNALGCVVATNPAPVLMIQPSGIMCTAFMRDRIVPAIRDTPILASIFPPVEKRAGNQTTLRRSFPGGVLSMVSAGSAAALASRPAKYVFCDEVDKYAADVGGEGDAVSLAWARASNFPGARMVLASTPTIKGESRIWAAYEESTAQRFHIPCPTCGAFFALEWELVGWDAAAPDGAWFTCPAGHLFGDAEKRAAVARGQWVADNPLGVSAGYRISALYSPWQKIGALAVEYVMAKASGPERLKAFTNLRLGLPFEPVARVVEISEALERQEDYGAECPDGVHTCTLGADVQGDRIEAEVVGHGSHGESWGLGYFVLWGDTAGDEVWESFDKLLKMEFQKASGARLKIECACVDSGFLSDIVAKFCSLRRNRGVFAVRGSANRAALPFLRARPRKDGQPGFSYLLGVNGVKETFFHNLKNAPKAGPRAQHWPHERGYEADYWPGLLSERLEIKRVRGRRVRGFEKRRERNEPLDARIYSICALYILGPQWRTRETAGTPTAKPLPSAPVPGTGFVHSWR